MGVSSSSSRLLTLFLVFCSCLTVVESQVNLEFSVVFGGNIRGGDTLVIQYRPADNIPTTLALQGGRPDLLVNVANITDNATGGSYTWTIPSTILTGSYALRISRGSLTPNYSNLFTITERNNPSQSTPTGPSSTPSAGLATPSTATSAPASSSTDTIRTATSESSSPTSSPSSNPPNQSTDTNAGTLSTAAKAGIAVGAIVGALLIGVVAFWLGRNARRRKAGPASDSEASGVIGGKAELDGKGVGKMGIGSGGTEGKAELQGKERANAEAAELEDRDVMGTGTGYHVPAHGADMVGGNEPVELDGRQRGMEARDGRAELPGTTGQNVHPRLTEDPGVGR
ncbi:hypothetical protein B0J11DRAFT_28075 [Dendryphion nanum]|uniref:Yeast cell wall synthesis Kre9/Knh1-like N-terminal domain-containing protein n=1 Tax=Dendryphion nanum TaxID=256645 RepID=A0A9P9EK18_9PLEO|nr:hypothetical protein B0J11DRAFT_28075 [Dendryphion nanum]